MIDFLNKLTADAVCWNLEVNEHRAVYSPLDKYIADHDHGPDATPWDWIDEGAKARSLETGNFVTLQVYPDTATAFIQLAGDTIEGVVEAMERMLRDG